MATAYHHLIGTIVPPMGVGGADLLSALALCLFCLLAVIVLGRLASLEGRRRLLPALFALLSLAVAQTALIVWGALP